MSTTRRNGDMPRLWKVTVAHALALEDVEGAASDSVAVSRDSEDLAGAQMYGVELQRMEVDPEGRTTVFFSASDEAARAFGDSLKVRARGADVCCAETDTKELFAPNDRGSRQ